MNGPARAGRRRAGPRLTIGVLVALTTLFVGAVAAFADAPDPTSINASFSTDGSGNPVVTLTGSWAWTTHHHDCNVDRWGMGWAVDWNDSTQAGNHVGTLNGQSIDVGTPSDNAVHYSSPPRCGTFNGTYNTGTWGPISHTFPKGTTDFNVCVVTYDLHGKTTDPAPSGNDLVAGGAHHNDDNSVEKNADVPGGNKCLGSTTTVPIGTIGAIAAGGALAIAFVGLQVRSRRRRRNQPATA